MINNDMGISIGMGVPKNGWLIRENPVKIDDFGGTPISGELPIRTAPNTETETVFGLVEFRVS